MALVIRDQATAPFGFSLVRTWKHLVRVAETLPTTATRALFTITGGRILVHLLLGEVTVIIQTQTCNLLVAINPTTGTTANVASNLDITASEVGTLMFPEGDGSALVGADAGTGFAGAGIGLTPFIVPIGGIDITTSATNSGEIKWDLWYEPLDERAVVIVAA